MGDQAQVRVMQEFPSRFGHQVQESQLFEEQVQDLKRSSSTSSLSTVCPEERLGHWDGEVFCSGHCAADRAKWVIENLGLSEDQAHLRVMREFPWSFGIQCQGGNFDDSDPESVHEKDHSLREASTSVGGRRMKEFTHCNVPRVLNLAEESAKANAEVPVTTMMLRNLPNRYTQQELIEELNSLAFAGSFNFFYAPIDFGSMGNVGYAFVNFVSPAWAVRFQQDMEGYAFTKHQQKKRRKIVTVSVAYLQGLQANLSHYECSAVTGRGRSKRCGPVVMPSISATFELPSEATWLKV